MSVVLEAGNLESYLAVTTSFSAIIQQLLSWLATFVVLISRMPDSRGRRSSGFATTWLTPATPATPA